MNSSVADERARFWPHTTQPATRRRVITDQRGAILVGLIVTLMVAAVMGATMSTLTTTSTFTEVAARDTQNAYYMAYSGLKYYDRHPTTLQLSSTPLQRILDNGSRFELAIETDQDGQPRLASTGVIQGLAGESRWRIFGTGTPGSISYVDTMEDTDNWSEDGDVLGRFSVTDIDGNSALRLEGEALEDADTAASSDTVDKARQLLADAADAIANAFNGAGNTFDRDIWQAIANDIQNASSLAEALAILNVQLGTLPGVGGPIQLPSEILEPKAFAVFDWRTANNNSPIPLFDYWGKQNEFSNNPPYDHQSQTLSYDVQAKFAIRPELEYYMAGLSLRLDDSIANGGEMLGVSIVRGNKALTDLIPDALVPEDGDNDGDDPLIVVWSAIDTDANGIITPKWEVEIFGLGIVQLWPKERDWLAYAQLDDGYCLTEEPNDKYFRDWITLMARIEERELSSGVSPQLPAGQRVNAMKVFLASNDTCAGGGAPNGNDSFLDNQRGPNQRLPANSKDVRWPVFDVANYAAWNDNFTMLGGGSIDLEWNANPAPEPYLAVAIVGQNEENAAILVIDAQTNPAHATDGYSAVSVNDWPAELGLHMFGEGDPSALAPKIYVDDYGLRLEGPDPDIR